MNSIVWMTQSIFSEQSLSLGWAEVSPLFQNVIMTVPLTQLCLKFIVPRPVKLSSEWDGVFRPFEPELWAVTGLVALAMSFFLQRLTVATRKYTSGESIKSESSNVTCERNTPVWIGNNLANILKLAILLLLAKRYIFLPYLEKRGLAFCLMWNTFNPTQQKLKC